LRMIAPCLFITLEGCEGCGKSTQSTLLFNNLLSRGIPCVLTHEPGGTPLGERIRALLKIRRDFDITPEAELFLFAASRTQLVKDVIKPSLSSGKTVICDRFADSTIAYQGYGRGLDLQLVESVNALAADGLKPNMTVLIDTPPELGLRRKRHSSDDRFEAEAVSFHARIRDGYLAEARKEPGRWVIVQELGRDAAAISQVILASVLAVINGRRPETGIRQLGRRTS
jgi:dTMP kinase